MIVSSAHHGAPVLRLYTWPRITVNKAILLAKSILTKVYNVSLRTSIDKDEAYPSKSKSIAVHLVVNLVDVRSVFAIPDAQQVRTIKEIGWKTKNQAQIEPGNATQPSMQKMPGSSRQQHRHQEDGKRSGCDKDNSINPFLISQMHIVERDQAGLYK